jgi:hypothetical protein
VTKSSEVKDEMLMIMGPHQNWEQYLVPAPYTVKILGESKVLLSWVSHRFLFLGNSKFKFLV